MQNKKIALQRTNTAAFEVQNILAILTACTEAVLCFDVSNISEREYRSMLTIAEAVLEISYSPYVSPECLECSCDILRDERALFRGDCRVSFTPSLSNQQ